MSHSKRLQFPGRKTVPCLPLAFRGYSQGPRKYPSSRAVLCPWLGDGGGHTPLAQQGLGLGVVGGGRPQCCLPEADDSSVFVVGTVLYRNLGSFLALQRWASGHRWGPGRLGLGEVGAGEAGSGGWGPVEAGSGGWGPGEAGPGGGGAGEARPGGGGGRGGRVWRVGAREAGSGG